MTDEKPSAASVDTSPDSDEHTKSSAMKMYGRFKPKIVLSPDQIGIEQTHFFTMVFLLSSAYWLWAAYVSYRLRIVLDDGILTIDSSNANWILLVSFLALFFTAGKCFKDAWCMFLHQCCCATVTGAVLTIFFYSYFEFALYFLPLGIAAGFVVFSGYNFITRRLPHQRSDFLVIGLVCSGVTASSGIVFRNQLFPIAEFAAGTMVAAAMGWFAQEFFILPNINKLGNMGTAGEWSDEMDGLFLLFVFFWLGLLRISSFFERTVPSKTKK